ncbi:cryptococcal mannosyltransferase 1-domain-containing protein [Mycena floridula]|nr:cryptococcal mannosyltransferase 1-domain-containing protein [Mycena floridula]
MPAVRSQGNSGLMAPGSSNLKPILIFPFSNGLPSMRILRISFSYIRWVQSPAFPALSFILIHLCIYILWHLTIASVGGKAWSPSWPVPRTQIALLMVSIPLWALFMTWVTFQRFRLRNTSSPRYEWLPLNPGERETVEIPLYPSEPVVRWSFRRVVVYLCIAAIGVFVLWTYPFPADTRYRSAIANPSRGADDRERIFIAAMFYNNEKVLPHWNREMIKSNVYVSIIESYSTDSTPDLLRDLDNKLEQMGVPRRILIQDTSVGRNSSLLKDQSQARVDYLATLRNKALEPLVATGGYDRVLFSNDIYIEAESVVELLQTHDGHWDMVCGIDLSVWGMYDTWVLRDRFGRMASSLWPYLFDDGGRQAIMLEAPAPVFTCWNGIVAFRADPVLPIHLRSGQLSGSPLEQPLPSTHPAYPQPPELSPTMTPPLKFRPSSGKECFSSESFNFPYDLRRQFGMTRIYMNPRYVTRHWLIRWWMHHYERGDGMQRAKMLPGDSKKIWLWDGGECQWWERFENQTNVYNEDMDRDPLYIVQ